MYKNDLLSKVVLIIGTSTVSAFNPFTFDNIDNYIPTSYCISSQNFDIRNDFAFFLKHEINTDLSEDSPIPIPSVKKLKFKFSTPIKLAFGN